MKEATAAMQGMDPEFAACFGQFADSAEARGVLDGRTRMVMVLAALIGCQSIQTYREVLPAALDAGVTPVQIKEILYQATAYLGLGRARPFFDAANETLAARGVPLPLPEQATVTPETRLEAGSQAQVAIFGEHMRDFWRSGPVESRHINQWLAENCFGDWYTRGGLDLRERESITFCFLAAQGGCEPQLTSHAAANLRLGNGKAFLIEIVSQCLPYIGYPRALNALRCIEEAE